jgi:hypothetical protein
MSHCERRCVYSAERARERESDIRFEFRFVSLLVITQCFPAQRLKSIEAVLPLCIVYQQHVTTERR